ncbi:hypothetical protein ACFP3I_01550 [Chryseobacterium arachidis]
MSILNSWNKIDHFTIHFFNIPLNNINDVFTNFPILSRSSVFT